MKKSKRALGLILAAMVVVVVIEVALSFIQRHRALSPSANPAEAKALPTLLDLGSTSCVPCKQMQPILTELAQEYKGKVEVVVVDVYEEEGVTQRYGVKLIPTQIFFDGQGKEVFRHVGFYPKQDIVSKFRELGFVKDGASQ